jgi:hypothetical protein
LDLSQQRPCPDLLTLTGKDKLNALRMLCPGIDIWKKRKRFAFTHPHFLSYTSEFRRRIRSYVASGDC